MTKKQPTLCTASYSSTCLEIIKQHTLFSEKYQIPKELVYLDGHTASFAMNPSPSIDECMTCSHTFNFALPSEEFDAFYTSLKLKENDSLDLRIMQYIPTISVIHTDHGLIFVIQRLPKFYSTKELPIGNLSGVLKSKEIETAEHTRSIKPYLAPSTKPYRTRSENDAILNKTSKQPDQYTEVSTMESLITALGSVERILRSPNISTALKARFSHLAGQIAQVIDINQNLSNQSLALIKLVSQEVDQLKVEVTESLTQ